MDKSSTIMWSGTVRALPLAEQLKASQLAGCEALCVTSYDYTRWLLEGLSTCDMLAMADDHGIKLTQLDPYTRWAKHWVPDNIDPEHFPISYFGFDGDDFFRIAEALQVDSMSAIITCPAHQVNVDQLYEGYAATCKRASDLGIRCDLEFIPFWGLPTLEMAWDIVKIVDAPNSGLVFDFWHYFRGKPDPQLLETIPGDKISTIQMCDAEKSIPQGRAILDDNTHFRKMAGEGSLPVVELMQQLDRIGGLNRLGPEVFSLALEKLSGPEIATEFLRATASLYKRAGLDLPLQFKKAIAAQ